MSGSLPSPSLALSSIPVSTVQASQCGLLACRMIMVVVIMTLAMETTRNSPLVDARQLGLLHFSVYKSSCGRAPDRLLSYDDFHSLSSL